MCLVAYFSKNRPRRLAGSDVCIYTYRKSASAGHRDVTRRASRIIKAKPDNILSLSRSLARSVIVADSRCCCCCHCLLSPPMGDSYRGERERGTERASSSITLRSSGPALRINDEIELAAYMHVCARLREVREGRILGV